ncbi:MAG: ATP phosphoribosyltransferase regulatory subunit [Novosphingobium sp.]|nr:ATP phosphoribosyltransferase regulatory subunit [Novosphingobium sp.]
MFRFVDPASLRTLALRSDITVQVGRIAATSIALPPAAAPVLCRAGGDDQRAGWTRPANTYAAGRGTDRLMTAWPQWPNWSAWRWTL